MGTDADRFRDFRSFAKLVKPDADKDLRVDDLSISLRGADPVAEDGETEVARYGGVVTVLANYTEPGGQSLGLGKRAEGAGEVLVTSERLVVSLWGGGSALGALDKGSALLVFALPWDLIDSIAYPVKKTMTDRIAGGQTVTLMNSSTAVVVLQFIPASRFGAPPDAQPIAKAKAPEVMATLAKAAAEHRLQTAGTDARARLEAIAAGSFVTEDGDYLAAISAD